MGVNHADALALASPTIQPPQSGATNEVNTPSVAARPQSGVLGPISGQLFGQPSSAAPGPAQLSALAGQFEPRLPWLFRHLTRSLGSHETRTPDVLSFLMFQPEYLRRLMEVGEHDAQTHAAELRLFLER